MQDAALQNSLLPHAHALVLREMMQWVKIDPPAGMVEAKRQMLEELAEIEAEKAEAEARRLASPPQGCKRRNAGRQAKDMANRRLSGAITEMIVDAESYVELTHKFDPLDSLAHASHTVKSPGLQWPS